MALDVEKVEMIIMESDEKLNKATDVFASDLMQIRAGRANPHVLDKIKVDYYGTLSPLNQIGNVSVADAQCLVISPWDKSMLKEIEKAILVSDIGITPTNDGNVIRLVFPILTEERRRDIVKQVKKMSEEAKVAVRNVRRDVLDDLKKMNKNKEMTDDEYSNYEGEVEKSVAKAIERIEKDTQNKEKELMTL